MPARKPAKPKAPALPLLPAKPGRPAYVASDKDRTMVRLLCAGGITQDRIAVALGCSEPTLRRHFARDIKVGATEIDALAVGTLVAAMRGGGKEAVAAAKWWTQSRMGWTERVTVDDGKPTNVPLRIVVELMGGPEPPEIDLSPPRAGSRFPNNIPVQFIG